MTEMIVTCFTDIKGFTEATDKKGHDFIVPIRDEFLRVGKILIEANNGKHEKDIGDSQMASFKQIEGALMFATQLQQYYQSQPCLNREDLFVRIALFLGTIAESEYDNIGDGINKAARLEGVTDAGNVFVNLDLHNAISRTWYNSKITEYFEFLEKMQFKGIEEPQSIFKFRWGAYAKQNPNDSLAKHVCSCLESSGSTPSNINSHDLMHPGIVIWPAVPRKIATSVHRAQIEILRLLALLGWQIKLLVADCGSGNYANIDYAKNFAKAIEKHSSFRGLCGIEVEYLSNFFKPNNPNHEAIINTFQRITSQLKVQDLIDMNQKTYDERIKEEIRGNPTLDFLRPILTCSAVCQISNDYQSEVGSSKAILVSGKDERIQWKNLLEVTGPSSFGAIFHPELKLLNAGGTHTARQREDWPIWHSKEELEKAMEKTNVGKWTFQLFGQLPAFPANFIKINDERFAISDWKNEFEIPDSIEKAKITELVWPILDPSNS